MVSVTKGSKIILDFSENWEVVDDDINSVQLKLTGERFPSLALGICDNCKWCYSCINPKGIIVYCPECGERVSQIPIGIDEFCILEADNKRGITMGFKRQLPMR
jgi:hypothetical protein